MNLQSLKPSDLEKLFLEGIVPEPQHLIGSWRGIFLPFHEKAPVPLKDISTSVVSKTWGAIWKGKEIFLDQKTSKIKGINIVSGFRTLGFNVKKIKSRVDSGEAIEFDYSGNLFPLGLIRDEVRMVKGVEDQKLIGVMFLEFFAVNVPVIFFGLERI
ncbi:MAG: hypothetical protein NZ927_01735 [Candidatus Calescibacterium sp.]|nr:hypothetical protein [Candidatus Calescibacterium sp.]MCX7734792.1 hypothetical protein [bacterium]MDW8087383.1 hypothetical protein [Candidatus Calescibacterium sp.]